MTDPPWTTRSRPDQVRMLFRQADAWYTSSMKTTAKKRILRAAFLLATALLLSLVLASCLPGDGKATPEKPAGFLSGIWHGWVAPFSLIAGIFNHSIRVYEPLNSGWWYDFGFYIALVGGFGGFALSRKVGRRGRYRS